MLRSLLFADVFFLQVRFYRSSVCHVALCPQTPNALRQIESQKMSHVEAVLATSAAAFAAAQQALVGEKSIQCMQTETPNVLK
jgi:mevalonate pyrophosphate decarboxylase